jgi:hypothetical protein
MAKASQLTALFMPLLLLAACGSESSSSGGDATGYADGLADGVSGRMKALEDIGVPILPGSKLNGTINAGANQKGTASINLTSPQSQAKAVELYNSALIVAGYQGISTKTLGPDKEVNGKSAKAEIWVRIMPINNGDASEVSIILER